MLHCFFRKTLQRTGKDFSLLMVLPSGVYHYKFIVDGQRRYIPDLPFIADEMGNVFNLLNVSVSVILPSICITRHELDLDSIICIEK